MFQSEIKFVRGVAKIEQFINFNLPEIAFMGKSNVGKSSLINMLFNRKNLAKISHTPGRTQQINFFSVNDKFIVVDLPGYGFAEVPDKVRANWEKIIFFYLVERKGRKLICLLIDARRGIKEHDIKVMQLLSSYNIDFQIVYTKIDKIHDIDTLICKTQILLKNLELSCNVINTSSRSKQGAKELQSNLAKYIRCKN